MSKFKVDSHFYYETVNEKGKASEKPRSTSKGKQYLGYSGWNRSKRILC